MDPLKPIFPLGTVLFPGLPLPLHIFEERYKQMMRICIDDPKPFVVALIRKGQEALGGLAEPFAVGTSASIRKVDYLEDGKLNLLATGVERVRILQMSQERPYLSGKIEPFPYPDEDITEEATALRSIAAEFMQVISKSHRLSDIELPELNQDLIFLCASILPVSCQIRQSFLETERLSDLARDLHDRIERQLALIAAVGTEPAKDPYLN
ncbi:MAG: LON peptidase substrate-binding domain-containing protein [Spirochaetia bacterium]|nr:LON peptidase substrate-binding domain-containing protein [Spirochaetia bacterium]